jgi:hypothetical protein
MRLKHAKTQQKLTIKTNTQNTVVYLKKLQKRHKNPPKPAKTNSEKREKRIICKNCCFPSKKLK